MITTRTRIVCAVAAGLLWNAPGVAAQTASQGSELYHIHAVKAAPGKLLELIDAYKAAPAPDEGQPQVTPIILRHRQGGEWDILVISPRGAETTVSAGQPSADARALNERLATLSAWHADSFAAGPAWDAVRQALLPDPDAGTPVFVVSDYRAIPGHRPQLRQALEGGQAGASGSVLLTHVEGAPWNFLHVTRYASWADLGTPPPSPQQQGIAAREHMAVHHDTVATYVAGGAPIR